jgi:hypothetical protein
MEDQKRRKGVRHRRRSESNKLLADYRASGLTQKHWCKERGIGIASLRYWLKREREEAKGYSMVPVEVEGRSGGNGVLDLQVNGVDLRVGAGSDMRSLAVLLKELG